MKLQLMMILAKFDAMMMMMMMYESTLNVMMIEGTTSALLE
jgi:hypothetical protein